MNTGVRDDGEDDDYDDDMFYIRTSTPEKTNLHYSTNFQSNGTY